MKHQNQIMCNNLRTEFMSTLMNIASNQFTTLLPRFFSLDERACGRQVDIDGICLGFFLGHIEMLS